MVPRRMLDGTTLLCICCCNPADAYFALRCCCTFHRLALPLYTTALTWWLLHLRKACGLLQLMSTLDWQCTQQSVDEISSGLVNWNNWLQIECNPFAVPCQSVYWQFLRATGFKYAWCVRKEAALALRDLACEHEVIRKQLEDIHTRARERFYELRPAANVAAPGLTQCLHSLYESMESPWCFKMIQFNAALLAEDHTWMFTEPPSVLRPRRFFPESAEDTPHAPTDSSDEMVTEGGD